MEDGVHRGVGEGGDVGRGGIGRDDVRAEGIDAALHHDVRDVEDHRLQSGRQADLDHAQRLGRVQPELAEAEPGRARLPHEADEDQHDRHILRNDRRNGDARHVQPADDDEEQIEKDVQYARDGEEQQRPLRIAVGAQDGRGEVVDQRAGDADEIDPQIEARQPQHIVGRAHQLQHRRGEEEAQQERDHAEQQTQRDGAVDRAADARVVPAADIACDENVDAHGDADERAGQKVDERRGRADGGQRRAAREFADDDHVCRVEQQLQNARERQRQGKHHKLRQQRAVQHIKFFRSGHGDLLQVVIMLFGMAARGLLPGADGKTAAAGPSAGGRTRSGTTTIRAARARPRRISRHRTAAARGKRTARGSGACARSPAG